MELEPGGVVDRFVVERRIGRGRGGTVYRVRHRDLGVVHALELLDPAGEPARWDRLRAAGRLQAELRHPNVVGVLDLLEVQGRPALLTELVDGPSVARILEEGPPPLAVIDDIARGVLKGVRAAHLHGAIHGDLQPESVLLAQIPYPRADDGAVPKVADFALAAWVEPSRASLAPERLFDGGPATVRGDVYALGVLLYTLCAGAPPYAADDPALPDILRTGGWPLLEHRVPSLPDRVVWTVGRAMSLRPADRYGSVDEMLDAWTGAAEATVWHPVLPPGSVVADTQLCTTEIALPRIVPPTAPAPTPPSGLPVPLRPAVPPPPRSGGRWLLAAALGGGAAGAGLVAGVGAALFAAGLLLWSRPGEPEVAVRSAAPAPLTLGATPAVPPPVVAPPPAPDPPEPQAPVAAAADGSPADPPPTPGGEVTLVGDAERIRLTGADGRSFGPGPVPPGRYRLAVTFPGSDELTLDTRVAVDAGAVVTIDCRRAFFACSVR